MKTKRGSTRAVKSEQALPEVPPVAQPSEEVAEGEKINRISFPIKTDGTPDWDGMRSKTKEKLSFMLRDESVQKQLGISSSEAKQIEEIGFGEDEAETIFDLLQMVDAFGASAIYKVPMEITREAFTFTPDHRKKLSPRMQRLLNKWAPSILKTWKDEIGFGVVFIAVLNSQVQLMHILENKRRRAATAPRPNENKVTPISEPAVPKENPKVEEVETPVAKSDDVLENVGINA